MNISANCVSNTFINMLCEANGLADFTVHGYGNVFINCSGTSDPAFDASVVVSGDGNRFIGGQCCDFAILGSGENTILDGVTILGSFTNAGISAIKRP